MLKKLSSLKRTLFFKKIGKVVSKCSKKEINYKKLKNQVKPYLHDYELYYFMGVVAFACLFMSVDCLADVRLPGTDNTDKLEAAGTLLRIIDTGLFKWGSRIFAGISILSAGWHLKEQRFALAVVSLIGAVMLGTSPIWVRNIFEIGGGSTLFSYVSNFQQFIA